MECRICAKQYLCNKKQCTGLIRFSEIKDYGEIKKWEKTGKQNKNLLEDMEQNVLSKD